MNVRIKLTDREKDWKDKDRYTSLDGDLETDFCFFLFCNLRNQMK